jgi:hypothetical protein
VKSRHDGLTIVLKIEWWISWHPAFSALWLRLLSGLGREPEVLHAVTQQNLAVLDELQIVDPMAAFAIRH